jgi:hypothetical protein
MAFTGTAPVYASGTNMPSPGLNNRALIIFPSHVSTTKSTFSQLTQNKYTYPPQIPHTLVEGGRKDAVDIAEDALVGLEPQLSSQELDYRAEGLV